MSFANENSNGQAPANSNRFRILCRRADGSVSLVKMVRSFSEAVSLAQVVAAKHLNKLRFNRAEILRDSARPREVYLERWEGRLLDGSWEFVTTEVGGYTFEFLDHPPRRHRLRDGDAPAQTAQANQSPAIGASPVEGTTDKFVSASIVACELLAQRTKKGGWFARILQTAASGPITNWQDMPTCAPGQIVSLKLCGIKHETGFAQFQWVGGLPSQAKTGDCAQAAYPNQQ